MIHVTWLLCVTCHIPEPSKEWRTANRPGDGVGAERVLQTASSPAIWNKTSFLQFKQANCCCATLSTADSRPRRCCSPTVGSLPTTRWHCRGHQQAKVHRDLRPKPPAVQGRMGAAPGSLNAPTFAVLWRQRAFCHQWWLRNASCIAKHLQFAFNWRGLWHWNCWWFIMMMIHRWSIACVCVIWYGESLIMSDANVTLSKCPVLSCYLARVDCKTPFSKQWCSPSKWLRVTICIPNTNLTKINQNFRLLLHL